MLQKRKQQRPPGRNRFFKALGTLSPVDFLRVIIAYEYSERGHPWQTRRDGTPFSGHPQAAAWIAISELGCLDPRVIIDTLLHDIAENGKIFSLLLLSVIYATFGLETGLDMQAITKLEGESTWAYMVRMMARGPHLILAKLLDRLHNLRTLDKFSPEEREKQFIETREYHLKILVPELRSCGGIWAEYADQMEEKILEAMARYA